MSRSFGQSSFSILRYTAESYFKVFPSANVKTYLDHLFTSSRAELGLVQAYETQNQLEVTTIRRVLIDDDYFHWLKENQLENTNANRFTYATNMTDDDVIFRWENQGQQHEIGVTYLPVVVLGERFIPAHSQVLHETITLFLERMIQKGGNLDRFVVHPVLMSVDALTASFEKQLIDTMSNYIFQNQPFVFSPSFHPLLQNAHKTDVRFISVAYYKYHPAIISKSQLTEMDQKQISESLADQLGTLMSKWSDNQMSFLVPPLLCEDPEDFYLECLQLLNRL